MNRKVGEVVVGGGGGGGRGGMVFVFSSKYNEDNMQTHWQYKPDKSFFTQYNRRISRNYPRLHIRHQCPSLPLGVASIPGFTADIRAFSDCLNGALMRSDLLICLLLLNNHND